MRQDERLIYYYEMVVSKRTVHGVEPALEDLAKIWEQAYKNGEATLMRDKSSVAYRIADIKFDTVNSSLSILFRRSDKNAADAVYEHHKNGNLRHIPKQADEGGSLAVHMVLSLKHQKKHPNTYLMLLEGIPKIGHRIIQPLLNKILRDACSKNPALFTNPHPLNAKDKQGNVKQVPYVPYIELAGHLAVRQ